MLIEFRVTNFRSIREEQVLSLVAAKDKAHLDSHVTDTKIRSLPYALNSAIIYGPNASGKSNLINALAFVRGVVSASATQMHEGQTFNCPPFRLDSTSHKQPSEFEITFINDGVRYQYGFSLLPERVVEEWLLVYKTQRAQQWFTRRFNFETGRDEYEFSSYLTGQRKLWQDSTRSNALFLSTAVQLNSESMRPVFMWLVGKVNILGAGLQPINDLSIRMAQSEQGKEDILRFMNSADLSISDIKIENRKATQLGLHFEEGKAPVQQITEIESPFVIFHHRADEGSAAFELHDESTGTQRLFAFSGPIIDVLRNGHVLIVDELDNSLHSAMVRYLVNLFHSKELNACGAQLVFTTHDTSLLDNDIFRRDQIWFVEKNAAQATRLYPLTNFSPRKNEALGRGYMFGRYGALPFITDLKL